MLIESNGWTKLIKNSFLKKNQSNLKLIKRKIYQDNEQFSFLRSDNNKEVFKLLREAKNKFKRLDSIILIGTGGSSLGSKAMLSLFYNTKIYFLENLDPNSLKFYFDNNKRKKIGLLIISKSGETLEVLSLFDAVINLFKKKIDLEKKTLIITDKKKSTLRLIAKKYNINVLDHDEKIGGRFSCFSITGLLPLHLVGVNAIKLKNKVDQNYKKNILFDEFNNDSFISLLAYLSKKNKYVGHVFLVYIDSFNNIGHWYKQLWNESLGKKKLGMHLIPALGSVDQHSQLQMWLDGPKNLIFTIVIPKLKNFDIKIKNNKNILPNYLKGKNLGKILNNMAEATVTELKRAGVPVRIIYLKDDSINSAIELMTTLLLEVSLIGKLMGINPFDQPAVEKVKLTTKKILNKNE